MHPEGELVGQNKILFNEETIQYEHAVKFYMSQKYNLFMQQFFYNVFKEQLKYFETLKPASDIVLKFSLYPTIFFVSSDLLDAQKLVNCEMQKRVNAASHIFVRSHKNEMSLLKYMPQNVLILKEKRILAANQMTLL